MDSFMAGRGLPQVRRGRLGGQAGGLSPLESGKGSTLLPGTRGYFMGDLAGS